MVWMCGLQLIQLTFHLALRVFIVDVMLALISGVQRIADPADATGGESETVAKITSFSDHNGDVELDVLRVVVEEPYSGSAEELNGKQPVQGMAEKGVPFVHPESARACMEMFPLDGYSLESALRLFLSQVKLVGETQARQRVVDLFAMRYVECNPTGGYNKGTCLPELGSVVQSGLHFQRFVHRPQLGMRLCLT